MGETERVFLFGVETSGGLWPIDRSLEELLDHLAVPPAVEDALLGRVGPLVPVLDLVVAYERGRWSRVHELSRDLGMYPEIMPTLYTEAMRWAAEIQRS